MVPEIACLGTTPAHRALSRGQEHEESQTALGSKHKFLFCQVEAEGLAGEGREPVPYSLPSQALEPCLVPGAGCPVQVGRPCLAVHHQGQLPLSVMSVLTLIPDDLGLLKCEDPVNMV